MTNQDDILENDTSSMEEVEGNDYEPDIVDDEGSNEELIPLDPLDDWGMMRPTSGKRVEYFGGHFCVWLTVVLFIKMLHLLQ